MDPDPQHWNPAFYINSEPDHAERIGLCRHPKLFSFHLRNNAELIGLNTHRGAGTKEFLKVRDQVNRVILSIAVLLGSDP